MRELIRTRLTVEALAAHFGVALPTDAEIDAANDPPDPGPGGDTRREPRP
ncbi:hypothetical protein ACTG9Q_31625 [Actinokineospora sp. 24-640]